jgi:hypothetical protein
MAHKDPPQVERLLRGFRHDSFHFFIHLDEKSEISAFKYLQDLDRVTFINNRTKVRWASYSFVAAYLRSFSEILNSDKSFDYISVMSGQDYPIKPPSEIIHYLERNYNKNFICFEERESEWWKHAITRITKYHFTNFDFRGRYRIQYLLNSVMPDRKFPLPYQLYGGPRAMCMTLTTACADFVVKFMAEHKRLRRFAQFTWGPDEFLIPTIIMNSKYRSSVINNNFYYIDWSKGGSNPKTLTVADFEVLSHSDKFLARKFDISEDFKILDLLDGILFQANERKPTSVNF